MEEQNRTIIPVANGYQPDMVPKLLLSLSGQLAATILAIIIADVQGSQITSAASYRAPLYLVVAANATGFLSLLVGICLRKRSSMAAKTLETVGSVAVAIAFVLMMAMPLPNYCLWFTTIITALPVIAAVVSR